MAIAEQLAAAIAAGRLAPGTRLPPERAARGIARRQPDDRAAGSRRARARRAPPPGRRQERGHVRPRAGRRPRLAPAAAGLSAELRRQGGATRVEPISAEVEPAGTRAAAALELERRERVVVITRLRLAGGKPLAVERSSLPARLFPDIEDMDLGGSLYELMADGFGLRPVRVVERLESAEARPSDAAPSASGAAHRSCSSSASGTPPTARRSSSRATGSALTAPDSWSSRPGSPSEIERARRRDRRRGRRAARSCTGSRGSAGTTSCSSSGPI